MLKKSLMIAAATTLLAANTAFAGNYYVEGSIGVHSAIGGTVKILDKEGKAIKTTDSKDKEVDASFETGSFKSIKQAQSLGFGYKFTEGSLSGLALGLEAEFLGSKAVITKENGEEVKNDNDKKSVNQSLNSDVKAAFAKVSYDVVKNDDYRIFLAAKAGAAQVKTFGSKRTEITDKDSAVKGQTTFDAIKYHSQTNFAYGAEGGVAFPVSENFEGVFKLGYTNYGKPGNTYTAEKSKLAEKKAVSIDHNIHGVNASFGLVYSF